MEPLHTLERSEKVQKPWLFGIPYDKPTDLSRQRKILHLILLSIGVQLLTITYGFIIQLLYKIIFGEITLHGNGCGEYTLYALLWPHLRTGRVIRFEISEYERQTYRVT
jgi:hypothetical protein